MHSTAIIIFCSLLGTISASALPPQRRDNAPPASFKGFYHPKNLPDGSYHVSLDANGSQIHTKLDVPFHIDTNATHNSSNTPSLLQKRCSPTYSGAQVTCGNSNIDQLAWLNLKTNFDALCGGSGGQNVGAYQAIYSVYQGAQMYMCNYAHTISQNCVQAELDNALGDIGCQCQNYLVGFEWIPNYYKNYGFVSGPGFCANNK
ncbi:hypothetical protein EV356DRAFT_508159 [Viridothelium virens]|uniref:Secreted protein n=1 Tax=Viridothelium virens TaxID=1048519 RepID=A0A6A6GZ33_VIRVR|nr:hypothetical protein EV356DRAFT_508159 [Viridothelium virens]